MELKFSATGFWKVNNSGDEYTGDLFLNEKEGGIVLYIRIPNKENPIMSYLALPLEIAFITGTTINGAEITLVNCTRVSTESRLGSEEVFGYGAKFMLDGVNFNSKEDILFSSMTISIPGIIQWGDVSNYVRNPWKKDNNSIIDLKIVEPIEIFSNSSYSVSYYLSFSDPFDLMKEKIVLNQTPHLDIKSHLLLPINEYIDIANQIKRLIEIAVGSSLNFDSMIVENPNIYYEFEKNEHRHLRPLKVIHAYKNNNETRLKKERVITKHEYLFTLSELKKANFLQWQNVADTMEPILELYIDSIYNKNLSISRHFLNMVQALETYHARRIADSLTDYKKRIEKLLLIRPDAFRDKDRKLLLGGSKKFVVLKNRLADLLIADYKFLFHTGDFNIDELAQIIADTRNYYTHYSHNLEYKALKDEELITGFHILRNILEFYLLKELGFEEQFIHERIRERIKPVITSNEIRKVDQERN